MQNGKRIRKALFRVQIITSSIYLFIYLCITFATWHVYNPFYWIPNLPTMPQDDRTLILLGGLMWYGLLFFVNYINLRDNDDNKAKFALKFHSWVNCVIANEGIQPANTETYAGEFYDELRKERIML